MAISHFHLVSKILSEGCYIDISGVEIERCAYSNGVFDQEFEIQVDDGSANIVDVVVRLVAHRGQKGKPETFSAAFLVHDIRIAGVDYELRYRDRMAID